MNVERGVPRSRKPLGDRTNTVIAAASPLSSSSSSKPPPHHAKPSNLSLHNAERTRRDSTNPAAATPTVPSRGIQNLGNSPLRRCNPSPTGKCSPESAGKRRQFVEKQKDKGTALPPIDETIDARDVSTSPKQLRSSVQHGTINHTTCKPHAEGNQNKISVKRKDKGKAILHLEPIIVKDPSTSEQQFGYVHDLGAFDRTTFEPCAADVQKQAVEKIGKKRNTVSASLKTSNTEEPSTPRPHHKLSISGGTHDREAIKSSILYARRWPAGRMENVEALALPPLRSHPGRFGSSKKTGDDYIVSAGNKAVRKLLTVPLPRPKKKKRWAPNEDTEKLKAYFAEIDAFELAEEVASSGDSD